MNTKKILLFLTLTISLILFSACDLEINEKENDVESILYNKIKIENQTNITEDIELMPKVTHEGIDYNVVWFSNNETVVSRQGKVTRESEHKFVELSAKVEDFEKIKKFELVVIRQMTELETAKRAFNLNEINPEVTTNIQLPTSYTHNEKQYSVTYTSSHEAITNTGEFTAPVNDEIVEITATASNGSNTFTKTFKFIAKANKLYTNYISDLIFSTYIEGSSYNKAFQIYNGTGQTILLDNYKIVFLVNKTTEETMKLSQKIEHNESISFIYDDSRNVIVDSKNRNMMFNIPINGDDVIELYKIDNNEEKLVDTIGSLDYVTENTEPLKDITITRKTNILIPNPEFNIDEWDTHIKDTNTLTSTSFDVSAQADTDKVKPTIISNKGKSTNIYQGFNNIDFKTYFNVTDNVDENINTTNAIIQFDKDLDKYLLEEYTLTYFVSDSAGNYSAYTIKINVIAEGKIPLSDAAIAYYKSLQNGLTGEALKNALNDLISNHITFPYTSNTTDTWDILRDVDEDPNNPNNIIGIYSGLSLPKGCQDTVTPPDYCNGVEWNREHVWSKSRGDFGEEPPAGTDIHHLFAEERTMNSTKNNRFFTDCNTDDEVDIVDRGYGNYTCNEWHFEPRDDVKGDVARIIFYMAVRYEGENGELDLEIFNDGSYETDKGSKLPYYGDLEVLLAWHLADPVSEQEVKRNEKVYGYQKNRNPFIDYPEFVELVFG